MELMSEDWQKRFFDEAFKRIDNAISDVRSDVRANTKLTQAVKSQAEKTNGRVTRLEAEVFDKTKLPPIYRDPKVIQAILYISVAILLLVAAATGFDIGGLLV